MVCLERSSSLLYPNLENFQFPFTKEDQSKVDRILCRSPRIHQKKGKTDKRQETLVRSTSSPGRFVRRTVGNELYMLLFFVNSQSHHSPLTEITLRGTHIYPTLAKENLINLQTCQNTVFGEICWTFPASGNLWTHSPKWQWSVLHSRWQSSVAHPGLVGANRK